MKIVLPDGWQDAAGEPAAEAEDADGIWPEHWDAVVLFCALSTQWRTEGVGPVLIWLGLDYGVIEATARMAGIGMAPALFGAMRTMEAEALRLLNERRE